jgi:hypothetical protein
VRRPGTPTGEGDAPDTIWPGGAATGDWPPEDVGRLRRDVLALLDSLPRMQRAVLVLRSGEGLDEALVADLLRTSPGTVRTHWLRAMSALRRSPVLGRSSDDGPELEDRLSEALEEIAPASPDVDGLAEGARRYAARRHRAQLVTLAGLTVAALAVGAAVTTAVQREHNAVVAQHPPALTCRDLPSERATPHTSATPLSLSARAALVCADTSDRSIWEGSLPPDEPVSDPKGLDSLAIEPPFDKDTACPRLSVGPAFTLTVEGKDGSTRTYDNVDLSCNGWPALDRYYIALGEQQAVEHFDPRIDPFLPCPSVLGQTPRPTHVGPPALAKGVVFTAASACLHQTPDPTRLPVFRRPVRAVLGAAELAVLTREAATHGSGPTTQGCSASEPSSTLVVVRAMTSRGQLIELTGTSPCGLTLLVNWSDGDYWTVSQATADMIGSALGFPR